jgi:hypothetical protein
MFHYETLLSQLTGRNVDKPAYLLYAFTMNAIQQTVEIGADRRSLRLLQPLPESIPCGTAQVILQFLPSPEPASPAPAKRVNPLLGRAKKLGLPPKDERKAKYQAARRKLRELCGGSSLTVERFLAMKHADRVLEAAQEERLFAGSETQ